MTKRAILQIGTEKTGTTTLQQFLATNRASLRANGFLYPAFPGAMNHTGLAAFAMAPERADPIRTPFGYAGPADAAPLRARIAAAAADELDPGLTAIFCSEHCHSRLVNAAEVATLRDFLAAHFDEIEVSVCLRRQDQLAVSLHSTRIKSGGTSPAVLPNAGPDSPYFNYDRFLGLWEQAFGREHVHVRLFDRRTLVGGDIVADFVETWGLAGAAPYVPVADLNASLSPLALEFLRRVNAGAAPDPAIGAEELRGHLCSRLSALFPGRGIRPPRAAAEAFYALYRPSNEAVRARHFPDRAALFDDDFSAYGETGDATDFGLDDFAAVAGALHVAATREQRRLEAEIAIRDARLHALRDKPAEADAAIARALRRSPGYPDAHRTHAELLLRRGCHAEARAAAERAVAGRPGSHEYWHFLGMLRRLTGDLDGAAAAQGEALARAPEHLGARNELARIAVARGGGAAPGPHA